MPNKILFRPTETKKYTVSEIINQSEVIYRRMHTGSYGDSDNNTGCITTENHYGPQAIGHVINNAMQLSASLNLFGSAKIDQYNSLPPSFGPALKEASHWPCESEVARNTISCSEMNFCISVFK